MNRALAWFAENHVAANILMALLMVCGLLALPQIKREVFPSLELPIIGVTVDYPGASPREVEQAICVRIEEELQGVQGVREIRSTASEGRCSVTVELEADQDVAIRMNDVRTRVDGIDSFPEDARSPVIQQAALRMQVMDVAVSGDVDEWTLKRLGEQVRDEILALPGITDVELVATRPYEISIEVSEQALLRHGITFDDVVAAVQRSSVDLPGGSLKTRGGEILLRTRGQAYDGQDFENLLLLSGPDGTRLRVGDVARVIDGFAETDNLSRFDGDPAVLLEVFRVGQQSSLEIADTVRAYLRDVDDHLPEGVSVTIAQDDSRFLRARIETLLRNGRGGFVLVLLVLALFLRLRLAGWVSLGIPLSFLGALAVLPAADVSINLISLMAFIVVLGIVVDDAIVVGENTCTEQAKGGSALAGAIRGVQGVALPVVFGVLTTMAAFAPMLFIPGPMGRITRVIPIVVCACLFFSLLESLFVLPSHLGHGQGQTDAPPRHRVAATWRRFQDAIARSLARFIAETYRPFLERALARRYLTAAAGLSILVVTAGLLAGGHLRFVFQPDVEGDVTVAYVNMPLGTPTEVTSEAVHQIEQAANALRQELDAERDLDHEGSIFAHMLTSLGHQPYRLKQATGPSAYAAARGMVGAHLGEVQIEVVGSEARSIPVAEITRRWRERTGQIAGAEELTFASTILSAGSAVAVQLSGHDLDSLRDAARELRHALAEYPGVLDISDSFRGGKQELDLEILPEAEALGISRADLGRQVRQAFYGHEAQRVQRGRDDVRVMVRYPAADRHSLGDLEQMRIRAADGSAVPFSLVASAHLGEGFSTISRVSRRRVVTVSAEVDPSVTNANDVVADRQKGVLPGILATHPGVHFSFEGEQREQSEFLEHLGRGWLTALLVIYALLAVPLRSYLQPLIIMSAIPFGLVGAVWGHVLLGHDFSMFSLIGLVALSGVVVNDSLVMVDYVNERVRQGTPIETALREAGGARFRAILLTSLTTFVGLTPLMAETSVQAQMLIPMAISLAFGVIFATSITLVLVPAATLILDDWMRALRRVLGREPDAADGSWPVTAPDGVGGTSRPS